MDLHLAFATKEGLWRLQNDMKSVHTTQVEHSDRLLRLERRLGEDSRMKSVWEASSFPNPVSGTSHQDTGFNPAAEAFKTFDQDHDSNLLGGLQLETEDEPRRGASRANSVRFDESALHGHLSHTSRSSSEIFPVRTGSAFGSHPMTERSFSHKSDGRQSSAGHSTYSTRLNSLAYDSRPPGIAVIGYTEPAPGLSLLGPLPSIIRCWLDTRFSNESLLYAAVCTGSFRSALSLRLVKKLGFLDQMSRLDGKEQIKIPVYFPEATIQQSSARSASPAPQLPLLTVTFEVIETNQEFDSIDVFLGSDILRVKNADILFSESRMTIYDDDHNKLAVPLVRPEKASLFEGLNTVSTPASIIKESQKENHNHALEIPSAILVTKNGQDTVDADKPRTGDIAGSIVSQPSREGKETRDAAEEKVRHQSHVGHQRQGAVSASEIGRNSPVATSPSKSDQNGIWTRWRRDSSTGQQPEATFSSVASSPGFASASRGKGMKVLKPARLSTSRSPSLGKITTVPDLGSSRWTEDQRNQKPGGIQELSDLVPLESVRRVATGDAKPIPQATNVTARSPNPIGGASAFGWLNSSQRKTHATPST